MLGVPRVAELLADPAFGPLAEWLKQRGLETAQVQAAVDEVLAKVRRAAWDEG